MYLNVEGIFVMKKFVVVCIGLIFAFPLFAQPKLQVVEGVKFDLGKVNKGDVSTKRLTLRNIGTEKLDIGNVEVSCGCTGTVVSNKELKPGDTTSLMITFNSKNFSGPVHKTVTVNSNAADAPRTVIEFTANVQEDLSINPLQFYFKDAEVGRKATVSITMKNQSDHPIDITGFRTQLENFTLTYPSKTIPPGGSVDITAEYSPKKATAALSDGVFIQTSSKVQPEVYVYIFGTVKEFKFE